MRGRTLPAHTREPRNEASTYAALVGDLIITTVWIFSVHRYAHYDQNPSFSDFSSFGGWYKPTIKQYEGDARVCNVDIDADWYP